MKVSSGLRACGSGNMKAATMRAVLCAVVLLALASTSAQIDDHNGNNNNVLNVFGIRAQARANAVTEELLHASSGDPVLAPSHLQYGSDEHELPTSLEDGEENPYNDYDAIDPAYYTASPRESGGHEVRARQVSSPVSPSAILTGEVSVEKIACGAHAVLVHLLCALPYLQSSHTPH